MVSKLNFWENRDVVVWGKRENSGGEELMKRTVGQNQKLQKGEKADKNIKKVNFQIENPTV